MAHDEALAARMREVLGGLPGLSEKRMMGGMCVLLDGNMVGGTHRDKKTGQGFFMFRVGKENEPIVDTRAEAIPMVQGGRRMSGLYFVTEEDCTDTVLTEWCAIAVSFAGSLPPKG